MRSPLSLTALLACLAAGCATNYDFATGRGSGGNYDVDKLRRDLGEEEALRQSTWIPLVHFEAKRFGRSRQPRALEGYALGDARSWGPLFTLAYGREWLYDAAGAPYEFSERWDLLWFLWGTERKHVKTPGGTRVETYTYVLNGLLHSGPKVEYRPDGGVKAGIASSR